MCQGTLFKVFQKVDIKAIQYHFRIYKICIDYKNNGYAEFKVHLIHRKQVPLLHNTVLIWCDDWDGLVGVIYNIWMMHAWGFNKFFRQGLGVNRHSCIDAYSYSCLHQLSNERKSIFKSGDSCTVWTWVWTWKYLKCALLYLHDVIYRKHCGSDWSFRRCFCSRKRCVRLWRCDDVRTFESTQPTPFC